MAVPALLACGARPLLLPRHAAPQQRGRPAPQRAAASLRSSCRTEQLSAHSLLTRRARLGAVRATASADDAAAPADGTPGLAGRVKQLFGGAKMDKAKLAALGTSALLAYGFVSNVNAVTLLIISWVSFAKSTGLSPLAPGQWKAYLLAYTALYAVVGNGLRPIRFSISVAITPFFDRFVAFLQARFNVAKPVAFGMCVFLVNVCGTCTYLALGLRLVTLALGLPFLP